MQKSFGPKTFSPQQPYSNSTQTPSSSSGVDLHNREAEIAKKEGIIEERERQIVERQKSVDEKLEQLEKIRKDLVIKL